MHCDSVAGEPDLFSLLQPPGAAAFGGKARSPSIASKIGFRDD